MPPIERRLEYYARRDLNPDRQTEASQENDSTREPAPEERSKTGLGGGRCYHAPSPHHSTSLHPNLPPIVLSASSLGVLSAFVYL